MGNRGTGGSRLPIPIGVLVVLLGAAGVNASCLERIGFELRNMYVSSWLGASVGALNQCTETLGTDPFFRALKVCEPPYLRCPSEDG